MIKIPFILLIFFSIQLHAQTAEQQELIDKTIAKYLSHRSISYDADYSIKFFDDDIPAAVKSKVGIVRMSSDTIFGSGFIYSRQDSVFDVLKYYKPGKLVVIDKKKELITTFDAAKNEVFPVTGNIDGSVLETYFSEIDRLKKKLGNPLNKVS